MSSNVNDRYLEARVMSASPAELIRMLYSGAQQAVREARRHLAAGHIAERSREISRAMGIVLELAASLDRDKGGDLAGQLAGLYDYIGRRLFEANLRQQDEPLAEVLGLLATLAEAWDELGAARPEPAARVPQVAESVYAPGYGSFTPAYGLASQSWSA